MITGRHDKLIGTCHCPNERFPTGLYNTSTVQTVGGGGTRFVAVITVCDETDTPDLARRER